VKLIAADVTNFKSIEDSDAVKIDPAVTVLVGLNESGKTAFLQALHKARAIAKDASYQIYEDYPRKSLSAYERVHEDSPTVVATLTYELEADEIDSINDFAGFDSLDKLAFKISHRYDNGATISLSVPESA
jgi:predicted ATP-dependent endonuclease of OLD family